MTMKQKTVLRVLMLMTVWLLAGPGTARAADDDQPTLFNSSHNQSGAAPLFLDRTPGSAGATASQGQGIARPYSFFNAKPEQKTYMSRPDFEKQMKARLAANIAASNNVHHQKAMAKLAEINAILKQHYLARQQAAMAGRRAKMAAATTAAAPVSSTAVQPVPNSRSVIYNAEHSGTSRPLFLPQ